MEDGNDIMVAEASNRFRDFSLQNNGQLQNQHDNNTIENQGGGRYYKITDLPNVLIVTNASVDIFDVEEVRFQFELLFRSVDANCLFHYLKSFRRARIEFASSEKAVEAKIRLNDFVVCGQPIRCYFAQPIQLHGEQNPHLVPPEPTKNFLLSPPASPPIGWEPILERPPVTMEFDVDLLSAMANLVPGQEHELHPASGCQPSIVVSVCENPVGFESRPRKIVQTRWPGAAEEGGESEMLRS